MNKKIKFIIAVVIVLIIIGLIYFIVFYNKKETPTYTITNDSLQFKNEYEALNNTTNDDGEEYLSLDIKSYNPIVYSSYEEIFELLKSGSGVIYFGEPDCEWCRILAPVLIDSALDYGIDKIYYLDISADRNILSLNKKGTIVTKYEGTDDYLKLVDLLSDYLDVYDGLNDDTIKRIYLPTVVFIKDGKVVGVQESLTEYVDRVEDNPYENPMNVEEKNELANIFKDYYKKIED